MFRFAICNEVYRNWPFERAMAHARASGYEGIEIAPHTLGDQSSRFTAKSVGELHRAVANNGLSVVGLHWLLAETSGLHWTTGDIAVQRATIDYFTRLIDLSARLDGRVMVLGSPQQRSLPLGQSKEYGLMNAARVVEAILPQLESNQIVLAIEPLGPAETNFLNTAQEVVDFIQAFESRWVRLHLDVKAMTTESTPIPTIIQTFRDQLAHFHANDPNLRGPGMGNVDFVPILRSLLQMDYRDWVSVEVFDQSLPIELLVTESINNLRRDLALAESMR